MNLKQALRQYEEVKRLTNPKAVQMGLPFKDSLPQSDITIINALSERFKSLSNISSVKPVLVSKTATTTQQYRSQAPEKYRLAVEKKFGDQFDFKIGTFT